MSIVVKDGVVYFKSTAHLAGISDFDRDHWINKEMCGYLNKKVYERTEQRVVYCPDALMNVFVNCEKCGENFKIDFLEKRPPCLPFYDGKSVWIPSAFDVLCKYCGHTQMYEFEPAKYDGDIYLFGDEAIRDNAGKTIISFSSLMSLPVLDLEKFKTDFLKIKASLCPSRDPESWPLHMKDIWHIWEPKKSKKRVEFRHITKEQLQGACISLGELLKEHSNGLIVYNCTGVFHKTIKLDKHSYKQLKERIYYPLLMRICSESSKSGVSPHMFFEETGDDGWAKNLFTGGRLTGMWPVLTGGMPIASPIFVPKGYDFRLEIADYVSFVVARYLLMVQRRSLGAKISIDADPSWLGTVRYLGYTRDGYCKLLTDTKYPLYDYFKGTDWVRYG